MQKLINVLAVTSFVVSAGVVGGGVYLYANKDALIDKAKDAAAKELASIIPSLLPPIFGGGGSGPAVEAPLPVQPPMFNPFN